MLISVVASPVDWTFEYRYIDHCGSILKWRDIKPCMKRSDIAGRGVLIVIDDGMTVCQGQQRVAVSYASHLGMYAQATLTSSDEKQEDLRLRKFDVFPVIDASHMFFEAPYAVVHVSLKDIPIFLGNGKKCLGVTSNIVAQVSHLFGVNLEENIMGVVLVGLQADCKIAAGKQCVGLTMNKFERSFFAKLDALLDELNSRYRPEGSGLPPIMVGVLATGTCNMMRLDPKMAREHLPRLVESRL